jgi:beta-glucosidase
MRNLLVFLGVVCAFGPFASNVSAGPPVFAPVEEQAKHLVDQMTLDEKIAMTFGTTICGNTGTLPGVPRLGIPHLFDTDGPVGVTRVGPAGDCVANPNLGRGTTRLPSAVALAASFDTVVANDYGRLIGQEIRNIGFNWVLGVNVNLARDPRGGRVFEAMGEDPILAGTMAAEEIEAIQKSGIVASIKHFAMNDQEAGRHSLNAVIAERSLRETDLLAFEIGVKESGVSSIMCGYNWVNGDYNCANDHLLNKVLKEEWGFKGFVHSDWWVTDYVLPDANKGLDVDMPGYSILGGPGFYESTLKASVLSGEVPEVRLNDMVKRVLIAMIQAGLVGKPQYVPVLIDQARGEEVAQHVAEQGLVLLKNADSILPLDSDFGGTIAVIGSNADIAVLGGGGSSYVKPIDGRANVPPVVTPFLTYWFWQVWDPTNTTFSKQWDPSSPLHAIQHLAPNATVAYDNGTHLGSAASLAASSDIAIVFVHSWEGESMDLESLSLDSGLLGLGCEWIIGDCADQDALVSAVAAVNPHTIVVVESGGAVLMPWLSEVRAVLEAWYPGIKGGEAIANILFGKVNPSGKLPLTFPMSELDLPRPTRPSQQSDPPYCIVLPELTGSLGCVRKFDVDYDIEGTQVGYKWFDAQQKPVLFPFGYGLSYTNFSYSKLEVTPRKVIGKSTVRVKFDLKNTGDRAGTEVAQVYVGLPSSTMEPPKRLVGWQKVFLNPGQTRQVTVELEPESSAHPLSFWNVHTSGHGDLGEWDMAEGTYNVYVGSSSRDIRLAGDFRH